MLLVGFHPAAVVFAAGEGHDHRAAWVSEGLASKSARIVPVCEEASWYAAARPFFSATFRNLICAVRSLRDDVLSTLLLGTDLN